MTRPSPDTSPRVERRARDRMREPTALGDGQRPFVAVIMAGGQGQRFWPLSTPEKPKQFLDLQRHGRTLLQATFDRLVPLTGSVANVYVATAARYAHLVREQLPELPFENVMIEPVARDSGPAIAMALLLVQRRHPGSIVGVFSSDHRIADVPAFQLAVRDTAAMAQRHDGLLTIGITPTRPATGYGYVECDHRIDQGFRVARFVEKPSLEHARTYVESGRFLWNAGIFVWRPETALAELERHAPDIVVPLREAIEQGRVDTVFPNLPKISIDYALLERSERVYTVQGTFGWDDIGDWIALERLVGRGSADPLNTVLGRHVGLRASGNIVYTDDPNDVVVTVGVDDLVIVKRGNAVLLVRKDRVAEIKDVLADERLAELIGQEPRPPVVATSSATSSATPPRIDPSN